MTKAETYTVEGMNAQICHYLARFHRKTKCYSKSPRMVILSLYLFDGKIYIMLAIPIYAQNKSLTPAHTDKAFRD
jgi:insertion element IS1 protein InsB